MEVAKKISTTIQKLVQNNTGVSIKSTFLLSVLVLGSLILLSTVVVLLYDLFIDGKVDSAISDIASVIGAVSALFVAAGLPKIAGEITEKFLKKSKDDSADVTE